MNLKAEVEKKRRQLAECFLILVVNPSVWNGMWNWNSNPSTVSFSGRYLFREHLQRYELEYSTDGQTWTKYSNDDGSVKVPHYFLDCSIRDIKFYDLLCACGACCMFVRVHFFGMREYAHIQ